MNWTFTHLQWSSEYCRCFLVCSAEWNYNAPMIRQGSRLWKCCRHFPLNTRIRLSAGIYTQQRNGCLISKWGGDLKEGWLVPIPHHDYSFLAQFLNMTTDTFKSIARYAALRDHGWMAWKPMYSTGKSAVPWIERHRLHSQWFISLPYSFKCIQQIWRALRI